MFQFLLIIAPYLLYFLGFILVILLISHIICYLYFLNTFIIISYHLYNNRLLQHFLYKNREYFLDIKLTDNNIIKCVKINGCQIEQYLLGYIIYNTTNIIQRNKLDYIKTSDIYDDYDNWNKVSNEINLPQELLYKISEYLADKKCDFKGSSNDKKYYNIV